jgi:hypothetical protein
MPRWAVVTLSVAAGLVAVFVLTFVAFGTGDEAAGPAFTEDATTATTQERTTEETTTQETTTQETTTARPPVPTLRVNVRGGSPAGGIQRLTVRQGERVRVRVTSDVGDHVHVHGYDLFGDVAPGSPATIQFRANLTGRFEIELEDRGTPIAELEVRP